MLRTLGKHVLLATFYGSFVTALLLISAYIYYQESRTDLKPWHLAELEAEFTVAKSPSINTLENYMALENVLFAQLQQQVYERLTEADHKPMNRYYRQSKMHPENFPINWNRTFELKTPHPEAGVLLLHGLSDSPYSLRALGHALHQRNMRVTGLRLPGHGTAPSGLLSATWQDFAAAVEMAIKDLRTKLGPDKPIYLIGYSNGAALAVHYSLKALQDENLPKADRLVLLSPAIAVSSVAALAIWQERMARLLDLEKLAWSDIQPEFDPYKYNSFTVNAGNQIYQLTRQIAQQMQKLQNAPGGVAGFPQTLAFVSIVDATIPPITLIEQLFDKLAADKHQLVIFDVNRESRSEQLLRSDPDVIINRLVQQSRQAYGVTLVTNTHTESRQLTAHKRPANSNATLSIDLPYSWPQHLFSLSHVALPFAPNDPIYGAQPDNNPSNTVVSFGNIWMRGERNLLQIPDNFFIRLRYNPFFDYLENRTLTFLNIDEVTQ